MPAFGRFTGSARGLPVTMPSSSVATSSPDGMRVDVGRVAHLLVVLDVVVGVGAVPFHAVVVHAPVAAVVVAGVHEAGHELDRVVVARTREHAEPAEDLEPHAVVLDHVELRPVRRPATPWSSCIVGGGSIQIVLASRRARDRP